MKLEGGACWRFLSFRRFWKKRTAISAAMIATAPMAPTAIPALAPVDRPWEAAIGAGEVDTGRFTGEDDDDEVGMDEVLDGVADPVLVYM